MGRWARVVAMVALVASGANALPDEDRLLSLVPWKVLEPGESVDAPLALFWIPVSRDDLRRSALLTSNDLTLYAARCVAMRVVRIDDGVRLAGLEVDVAPPVAVLVDASGNAVGRVESVNGTLSVAAVEELVRNELDTRAAAADARLDEARRLVEEGELDAAAVVYRSVWEARCVCPRQGKAAQRALRKIARK